MVKIIKQLNEDTCLKFIDILKAVKNGEREQAEALMEQLNKAELEMLIELLEIKADSR